MPAVPAKWRRLAWGLLFQLQLLYGQTDLSNSWEDFFSYNKVKDLMIMEERVYAITDNAAFIYDEVQSVP